MRWKTRPPLPCIFGGITTIHEKDRAAFDRLWDGQYLGFKAASHKDNEGSLELQRFVDQLRRRRS